MQGDVKRDLRASTLEMKRVVWPAIAEQIGGGEYLSIESGEARGLVQILDTHAGIDGFQVTGDGMVRAIASRVQWGEKDWRSFTIRHERDSGTETEYAKRLRAVKQKGQGWLAPGLTIHAYVEKERTGRLLSVGATYSEPLYLYLEAGEFGTHWHTRSADNAIFRYVYWRQYRQFGKELLGYDLPLFVWPEGADVEAVPALASEPTGFCQNCGVLQVVYELQRQVGDPIWWLCAECLDLLSKPNDWFQCGSCFRRLPKKVMHRQFGGIGTWWACDECCECPPWRREKVKAGFDLGELEEKP